ncbi:hypothetical protein DL96DRAFT_1131250 [Flagelloscypha sp. PMI_526]|nr:hypothetical protein DL96DRAFT_1131250 [Flagelloscypha sp. PMI_526]
MDEGEEALAELYTRQYEHHLRETQAHISGQISEPHTSQVTFLPPGSFWTPTEKALFFHALSVHSRLRPDLVASCIPTKNVVEVCALIDLFDQEVAVQAEATIERDALPISYDISDAFLALEVEQATILTGREIPCNVSEEPGPVKNVLQRLEQAHLSVLDSMLKNYGMEKQGPEDKEPNAGALSTSPPRSASPALDPDVLSPASKRRYQKRIYMRQRRAEASGTAVNTSIAKLRVGRARKERLPRKPRPTKYNICQKSAELIYDSDEIMDDGDQSDRSIEALFQPSQQREKLLTSVAHKNLGGKTKYQKARDLIGAAGLEVQDIQDYGLDLFYLSRIGKRIVTFGKREGDLAATAIDVQVLTLLRTIVTEFVVEVMERALLLREQELQMKEDTRAWRISDIDEVYPSRKY